MLIVYLALTGLPPGVLLLPCVRAQWGMCATWDVSTPYLPPPWSPRPWQGARVRPHPSPHLLVRQAGHLVLNTVSIKRLRLVPGKDYLGCHSHTLWSTSCIWKIAMFTFWTTAIMWFTNGGDFFPSLRWTSPVTSIPMKNIDGEDVPALLRKGVDDVVFSCFSRHNLDVDQPWLDKIRWFL